MKKLFFQSLAVLVLSTVSVFAWGDGSRDYNRSGFRVGYQSRHVSVVIEQSVDCSGYDYDRSPRVIGYRTVSRPVERVVGYQTVTYPALDYGHWENGRHIDAGDSWNELIPITRTEWETVQIPVYR